MVLAFLKEIAILFPIAVLVMVGFAISVGGVGRQVSPTAGQFVGNVSRSLAVTFVSVIGMLILHHFVGMSLVGGW